MVVATDLAKVLAVVQVMVLVEDLVMDFHLLAPISRQGSHYQHILGFP